MATEESFHAHILDISPDLSPVLPPLLEVLPQGPHRPLDTALNAVPDLPLLVFVLSVHRKVGKMDEVILKIIVVVIVCFRGKSDQSVIVEICPTKYRI